MQYIECLCIKIYTNSFLTNLIIAYFIKYITLDLYVLFFYYFTKCYLINLFIYNLRTIKIYYTYNLYITYIIFLIFNI